MPWTEEELALLRKVFANFAKTDTLPGYALIKAAQKQFPVLQKRTPVQIKSRFYQLLKMAGKHKLDGKT